MRVGVLYTDEHGLLGGPGVAVDLFMCYIKLLWVHWVSCGGAVKVYGGGALKCSLTLSPSDLPDYAGTRLSCAGIQQWKSVSFHC